MHCLCHAILWHGGLCLRADGDLKSHLRVPRQTLPHSGEACPISDRGQANENQQSARDMRANAQWTGLAHVGMRLAQPCLIYEVLAFIV